MSSLDDVPGAAIRVDEEFVVRDANPRTSIVFREPVEDIIGRSIDSYHESGLFDASALELWETKLEDVQSGATDDVTTTITFRPETDDRWEYDLRLRRVSDDGDVQCSFRSVGTSRRYEKTVTALHAATRRLMTADSVDAVLQRTAESAHEVLGFPGTGVRRYDPEREVLEFVAFGARVTGVDSRPPRDIADSPQGEAFRTGKTVVEAVNHEEDEYDRSSFTETMYVPIGETGVLGLGTIGNRFDETDLQFAEILADNAVAAISLVSANESLRRERERLDQFASVVSHDLKNPLNVAQLRTELLDQEVESDHLGDITQALDRMEQMIDSLLALARGGQIIGDRQPVDLADLVSKCWNTVEPRIDAELVCQTALTVKADETRLASLFENLLRNAVEHGGDDVTVTVGELADGFYVADDGEGIPPDEREEVFENGYSTADDGSGFGLSIVKRVAEAHGWEVVVTEGDDGGSRFEITGVETVS
ncbi:sensor histidine kinase [Halovenus salina]|uniref:sensor histidine kinase n=1 Tax=Halovenus salina TaxID=1510225 RepID=UPI002260DCFA|nr:GAF domain-containing sensor histidine kinase [Halovenus salina]